MWSRVLTPVESCKWATSYSHTFKKDGKTPRICGDYRLTLNKRLLQFPCTTEEPENILYRVSGSSEKRRLPSFYYRWDELLFTPDRLLCFRDRIVIHPNLRREILYDLQSGHLGVDKIKTLARLTYWWPETDADIIRIAKSCDKCVHKNSFSVFRITAMARFVWDMATYSCWLLWSIFGQILHW